MNYVELEVTSNFSFLRGASHPDELALAAAALGYSAIGIADRNSLAGVVRAHVAAKRAGIRLVVGARLDFLDAPSLLCFPEDRAAYGRLCELLTMGKRRTEKGKCALYFADLQAFAEGQWLVALPEGRLDDAFRQHLARLKAMAGRRASLAARHLYRGDDLRRIARLVALATEAGLPLLASNDVHAHVAERRPLLDILACIREGVSIHEAGRRLFANAERHLKAPAAMGRLFHRWPEALARAGEVADACRFSLDELRYEYPLETTTDGATPQQELERLVRQHAAERYPEGLPPKVRAALAHELALIGQLGYAPYFLTVHDLVRFARARGILCQGRGSAANSAVCFCLGITAVDPARIDLLFERFISASRNEPPDIDVDFEHERREEVIQYIYAKYGRDRAGLAATVISYRPRSAIRDVGKALGLSLDAVDRLARGIWGWGREGIDARHVRAAGLDPDDPTIARLLDLVGEIQGFPRHLSQHVGGFVMTRGPLSSLVPIENAAMEERTVIEWDKDDLDALGMLKVDVLSLGMLTCIRKGLELVGIHHGRPLLLADVPPEDPCVYDMLCQADSIGVFQVESRAQMTMLPRLRPRNFYDLVIEVAIVRPGPIQGDMVHPYLRRRRGEEKPDLPSPELREVLGKTLGVPLFQEQAMRIAIVAAGFSPEEADQLRRAMATFRKVGTIHTFQRKLIEGMVARGYEREFAERCFRQIEGFGEYGFPESHAASFALLVYVSAWLKRHYPAAFACALLNSQPMGFYAPAQILRDAREHGVELRPLDVNRSDWDCSLENSARAGGGPALRLGFRQARGLREMEVARLLAARADGEFRTLREVWRRTGLSPASLETMARADAFAGLGLDRRQALWQIKALGDRPLPLFAAMEEAGGAGGNLPPVDGGTEPDVSLPPMTLGEQVVQDYRQLGLSLRAHPAGLLRAELARDGFMPCARLASARDGRRLAVAGLVLVRQRPGTASGVIFATLEDESGIANLMIWPSVFQRFRQELLGSRLLGASGRLQREGLVIHLIADRLHDLSGLLPRLAAADATDAADAFGQALARADEVRRPGNDVRSAEIAAVLPSGRNFR
ncbi:MAG: error-prone DNA polymerase [Alphaproteobacteria bacterium]|nr:error-prone DNA polymerase [Alphaproteobacteria bacterium]